jgi:hypothetical protein
MRHPPYHLRTNKAVDRLLLIELLRAMRPNPGAFNYYSLGGPFLEDLRVMDHYFPSALLCSVEKNLQTFNRQEFNRFNSKLRIERQSLGEFLNHTYVQGDRDVFWLDYTDCKYTRFEEFEVVLKKVPPGSVVRLTLRAEPDLDLTALQERLAEDVIARIRSDMERVFQEEFAKVLPHPPAGAFASPVDYARMVQLMIRRAASTALDTPGSEVDFLHVHSMRYDDQTQMLSTTGVVCEKARLAATRTMLESVRFADFDWNEPHQINIPALSVKERHRLERLLPISDAADAGEALFNELGYHIGDGAAATKRQLKQYADYHREYPQFVRAIM